VTYQGVISVQSAPAIPASGTPLVNPFGFACVVTVFGGTVTVVAVGGTAVGLIAGTFLVKVGQSITLTYAVAPTWTWDGPV
jgi:hypothetical protein